jgi:4-amino-4-deoxy-L-arabinose transferase-like glycosyltransferase
LRLTLRWLGAGLLLLFLVLRLLHLQADFPRGMNWSGDLYTDEGWYASNALADYLTHHWYVAGDFNPAVNAVILPLLQRGVFQLLGVSFFAARLLNVLLFFALCAVVFALLSRYGSRRAAWLCLALLATNYFLFAFTRLALLELPMTFFLLTGIYLALRAADVSGARAVWLMAGASLALGLAVLTKASAVFALPLFAYLLVRAGRRSDTRGRWRVPVAAVLVLAGIFAGYYLVLVRPYQADFSYFTHLNISSRLTRPMPSIVSRLWMSVLQGGVIDPTVYPWLLPLLLLVLACWKRWRARLLFVLGVCWCGLSLVMIGLNGYAPPRYYLPLAVVLFMLSALLLDRTLAHPSWGKYLGVLLLLAVTGWNGYRCLAYISHPADTFLTMARDVRSHMQAQGKEAVLMGGFAASISLATGVRAINDDLGTRPLAYRITRYHPTFYVHFGEIPPQTLGTLRQFYQIRLLRRYDVYDNYYTGQAVSLFALIPKRATPQ